MARLAPWFKDLITPKPEVSASDKLNEIRGAAEASPSKTALIFCNQWRTGAEWGSAREVRGDTRGEGKFKDIFLIQAQKDGSLSFIRLDTNGWFAIGSEGDRGGKSRLTPETLASLDPKMLVVSADLSRFKPFFEGTIDLHQLYRELTIQIKDMWSNGYNEKKPKVEDALKYFTTKDKFIIPPIPFGGVTDDAEWASLSAQLAPAIDEDDEEASQEQVALASHSEDVSADDDQDSLDAEQAALASDADDNDAQPATDDDEEDLQEQVALASDSEDVSTDDEDDPDSSDAEQAAQPLATDDDDEKPLQKDDEEDELADASDAEDASADAPVMQTANAEAGADATADDQAGPQPATSAPVTPDDGFSFSLFAKQGVPVEVAKEALPADHLSPEGIPGSGMPAGESALPDVASEDVGNAAPGHERVVHHGDLAP